MRTLIDQIGLSAALDNLDDAVRPIQEILGVEDGGTADAFFDSQYSDRVSWTTELRDERLEALVAYVAYELAAADLG